MFTLYSKTVFDNLITIRTMFAFHFPSIYYLYPRKIRLNYLVFVTSSLLLMYLRKPFLIFALTLRSCSFPLDFHNRSEHPVARTRALYSVVDVDGNQASTPLQSTSHLVETLIQTFRSKYTSTSLDTNQPAGSSAAAQRLTEFLPAISMTISRSQTISLVSISAKASAAPKSTESTFPANPSYFIVNPEGTTAPSNIAFPTMTIIIKNDLRPFNTASALPPNFTNALVRIFSSASPTATAKSFSTSLHIPASKLSPKKSSMCLQPITTVTSVNEPTGNPRTSNDEVGDTSYYFSNLTSTTPARWNTKARDASPK